MNVPLRMAVGVMKVRRAATVLWRNATWARDWRWEGGLAGRRAENRRGYVHTEALSANMAVIVGELTGCCS
jgi:hypothetical protein